MIWTRNPPTPVEFAWRLDLRAVVRAHAPRRARWKASIDAGEGTVHVAVDLEAGIVIVSDPIARERVRLTETRPNFGGVRRWGLCGCGRRVAVLYRPVGARRYACRHCHRVPYASARGTTTERARLRLVNALARVGAESVREASTMRRPYYVRRDRWRHWHQEIRRLAVDYESAFLRCVASTFRAPLAEGDGP